jgi:hypothetical protein
MGYRKSRWDWDLWELVQQNGDRLFALPAVREVGIEIDPATGTNVVYIGVAAFSPSAKRSIVRQVADILGPDAAIVVRHSWRRPARQHRMPGDSEPGLA